MADKGQRSSGGLRDLKDRKKQNPRPSKVRRTHLVPAGRSLIILESTLFQAQVAWLKVLESDTVYAEAGDKFKYIASMPDQRGRQASAHHAVIDENLRRAFDACSPESFTLGTTKRSITAGLEQFKVNKDMRSTLERTTRALVQALVEYQDRRILYIHDILCLQVASVRQLGTCWSGQDIITALRPDLAGAATDVTIRKVVDVATLVAYGDQSAIGVHSPPEDVCKQLLHESQKAEFRAICELRVTWRLVHWAKLLQMTNPPPLQLVPASKDGLVDWFSANCRAESFSNSGGSAARLLRSWMFLGEEDLWPWDPPSLVTTTVPSNSEPPLPHNGEYLQRVLRGIISPPPCTITRFEFVHFQNVVKDDDLIEEYGPRVKAYFTESLLTSQAGVDEEMKNDAEQLSTRPSLVNNLLSVDGATDRHHLVNGTSNPDEDPCCTVDKALRLATAYNLCCVAFPRHSPICNLEIQHLLASRVHPVSTKQATDYLHLPTVCKGPVTDLKGLLANSNQLMASLKAAFGPSYSGLHFSCSKDDTNGDAHRRLLLNTFSIAQASIRSGCQAVPVLDQLAQAANDALAVACSITSCAQTVLQYQTSRSGACRKLPTQAASAFVEKALTLARQAADIAAGATVPPEAGGQPIGSLQERLDIAVRTIQRLDPGICVLDSFQTVQIASQNLINDMIRDGRRPKLVNIATSGGQHSELFVESMLSAEIDRLETVGDVLVQSSQAMWFFTHFDDVAYAWRWKPDRLAASENGIFIGWFHEAKPSTAQECIDKLVVLFTAHTRLLIAGACTMNDARTCLMELFDLCPVILTTYSHPLLIVMEGRFNVEFPTTTSNEFQPPTCFSVEVVAVYDTTNVAHQCVATCHMGLLFKSMHTRMMKHKQFLVELKESMGVPTAHIPGLRAMSRASASTGAATKPTPFFGVAVAPAPPTPVAGVGCGAGAGGGDAAASVPASNSAAKANTRSPISIGGAPPLFPQFHSFEDADLPACAAAGVKVQVLDPGADYRVYEVIGAKDKVIKVVPRDEGGGMEVAILQHVNSRPSAKAVDLLDTLHILSAGCECVGLVLARVTPLHDVVMSFSRHDLHNVIYCTAHAILEWHRAGVYHRDVKPSNLAVKRIGPQGKNRRHKWEIVILDASLSAWISPPSASTPEAVKEHTESLCKFVGTDGFTAPEVGHSPFTSASDVYSLGATITKLIDQTGLPMGAMLVLARDMMVSAPEARPTMIQVLERITAMA